MHIPVQIMGFPNRSTSPRRYCLNNSKTISTRRNCLLGGGISAGGFLLRALSTFVAFICCSQWFDAVCRIRICLTFRSKGYDDKSSLGYEDCDASFIHLSHKHTPGKVDTFVIEVQAFLSCFICSLAIRLTCCLR